ncbi:MAG: UDP-2,3-diacylglucosamine diphosphatase [Deltaproteobacteria bacterium]|nr:UDP-2,3-diacylglucosamine diphosphatase [Deltaproteobacteria bacterium]
MTPPASRVVRLPAGTTARFVGDLHLGDGARNDSFGASDERLARFLAGCGNATDAVVFMGDSFDLPQAFSARRIGRAHLPAMRALEKLARRVQVIFVLGNHDWTVDYERLLPGARACVEIELGDIRVMHGHQLDRYCHPGRRGHRLKVSLHNLAERLFGFEFRVPLWDHDTWRNRAAHWVGAAYGRHLHRAAAVYRMMGIDGRAAECEAFIQYWSRTIWGDPHALFEPARTAIREGTHRALVCGHTHLPGVVDLDGRQYANAGSWTFGRSEYLEWDGTKLNGRSTAGEDIGDRHYRWMIDGAERGDFFAWWAAHYEGRLRFRRDPTGTKIEAP